MLAAGLTKPGAKPGEHKPKYSGLHSLRHFFASWCINRKADGGLELPPMTVKGRMGHSSIQMTFDRYGHLFPRGDDGGELAAAERAFSAPLREVDIRGTKEKGLAADEASPISPESKNPLPSPPARWRTLAGGKAVAKDGLLFRRRNKPNSPAPLSLSMTPRPSPPAFMNG